MEAPAIPYAAHGARPDTHPEPQPVLHPALHPGDIVRHFKRATVTDGSQRYLYRVLAFAKHSETEEDLVVYEALYPPFGVWCRPLELFMGEVDHAAHPEATQRWRFEKVEPGEL